MKIVGDKQLMDNVRSVKSIKYSGLGLFGRYVRKKDCNIFKRLCIFSP